MDFIIATDSTCDLSKPFLYNRNIMSTSLLYQVNGQEYYDDTGLGFEDFYNSMRDGAKTSTSMINEEAAREFLSDLLKQGKNILYLAFDSALSGTYGNFKRIADELNETSDNKICVIDSLSAAGGEGLFVTLVDDKRKSGASFEETCAYAENVKQRIMHYFTVEDLKYLSRGGRLSKGTAFVGNLMNIKPLLHVDKIGRLVPYKSVFGRKKSIKSLAEKMTERYNGESRTVYISHGDCYDDAKSLADKITASLDVDITILPLDYVIGSHSGPGTLALFFTGDDRSEKD